MNIIETIAPIPMDELKKFFMDKETFYYINYHDSTLKGIKLLTYLGNLEIPSDINFSGCNNEEFKEIFDQYLRLEMICNIPGLEKITIEVIKQRKKLIEVPDFEFLISGNEDIIDQWISKLDSMTVFNMYMIDDENFKTFAETNWPKDETDSLAGINFVSLLKHENFYDVYQSIDQSKLRFFTKYFNEYMFKGQNLYAYWANENNPLFLLTYAISSGNIDSEEYIQYYNQDLETLRNVASL